jgi:two-component system sensor histidine kinase KdpD
MADHVTLAPTTPAKSAKNSPALNGIGHSERERVFYLFRRWGFYEATLDPLGFFTPLKCPDLEGLSGEFAEEARQAQVLQETEKLQSALLNSISHDLRTPLVSITGTLSSLQEDAVQLDDATRQSMVETAYGEAQRLNHLVGNLLDMSRIESGAMRVRQEWCDVQDAIGSALDNLGERIRERQVSVDLPATLPMVPLDFVLIVQVLVNLLDNALKYSPPRSRIEVSARVDDSILEIQVADRGIGIPPEALTRVFDKFYRVQRPDGVAGTGLGLAICKGIVEAHRGKIRAENREGGGTIVTCSVRRANLSEQDPHVNQD